MIICIIRIVGKTINRVKLRVALRASRALPHQMAQSCAPIFLAGTASFAWCADYIAIDAETLHETVVESGTFFVVVRIVDIGGCEVGTEPFSNETVKSGQTGAGVSGGYLNFIFSMIKNFRGFSSFLGFSRTFWDVLELSGIF